MAEIPSDNDLNFSDYENSDSDGEIDTPRPPISSVIAHKEMKTFQISDADDDTDKDDSDREESDKEDSPQDVESDKNASPQELEFEPISPVMEQSDDENDKNENKLDMSYSENLPANGESDVKPFEPISPVSDGDNNFETISPPVSPVDTLSSHHLNKPQFENISDDEDDEDNKKVAQIFVEEGKFSPVQESENELNFNDESSNDSGYQIIPSETKKPDETIDIGGKAKESLDEGKELADEIDEDDIEAPMPSPFSDIGDLEDITEYHGEIISDILKDTDATEQQFEFKNDIEEDEDAVSSDKEISVTKEANNEIENNDDSLIKEDALSEKESQPSQLSADEKESSETEEKGNEEVISPEKESEEKVEDETKEEEEGEKQPTEEDKSSEKEEKKPDDEEEGEDAGDLIADIFGESDEEEEFEGFEDEDLLPEGDEKPESDEEVEPVRDVSHREEKKDESDDDDVPLPTREHFVNDFDLMIEKKKEEKRARRRSKKDIDIISDNDEIIAAMITRMKEAAEEDRMLNQAGKAATKKLRMLASVSSSLRKADLQGTFIDCGVLSAIKEWLSPLPDHALPHINIRKTFLIILFEFPPLNKSALKSSGIGRAVMLLFKHPKETRENKQLAGKIISNWARPIFNVSTNFLDMTREEREDRDKSTLKETKRRRESTEEREPKRTKLEEEEEDNENKPRKPGDKGWCSRARVPQASNRDYVNRPISKLDAYEQTRSLNTKKPMSRYEKHALKMKSKKGLKVKAVGISLSGSKMNL